MCRGRSCSRPRRVHAADCTRRRLGIPAAPDLACSRIVAAVCSADRVAGRATFHPAGPLRPHACAIVTLFRQSAVPEHLELVLEVRGQEHLGVFGAFHRWRVMIGVSDG